MSTLMPVVCGLLVFNGVMLGVIAYHLEKTNTLLRWIGRSAVYNNAREEPPA